MLSFPSFRHVGHCRVPASFGQSTPMHDFLTGSSAAIVVDIEDGEEGLKALAKSVPAPMDLDALSC